MSQIHLLLLLILYFFIVCYLKYKQIYSSYLVLTSIASKIRYGSILLGILNFEIKIISQRNKPQLGVT